MYFDKNLKVIPRNRDKIIIAKGLKSIKSCEKFLKSIDKIDNEEEISRFSLTTIELDGV